MMEHARDEDCTVGEDGSCTVCGVAHGGTPCACGGRGFHREGCPEIEGSEEIDPVRAMIKLSAVRQLALANKRGEIPDDRALMLLRVLMGVFLVLAGCAAPMPASQCDEEYAGRWYLELGDDCGGVSVPVTLEAVSTDSCDAGWVDGCGYRADCPRLQLELELLDDDHLVGTGTYFSPRPSAPGCTAWGASR